MSKYSIYAVQLDAAFKEARAKYTEAYDLLKNAEAYRQQAGEDDELIAEHHLRKTTAAFDLVKRGAWEEFDKQAKNIRKNLVSTLTKADMADPEEVDQNGLTILQSGILSPAELETFFNRYSGNFTMQRLIGKHVEKLTKETNDPDDRQRLTMLAQTAKSSSAGILERFDDLVNVARICSGQSHGQGSPSYTTTISSKWDELTEEAIKNF